jgi:siroheme synthase
MRKMIMIAVAAAGFAFVAVPGVSAAPSYGPGAASAAAGIDLTQDVHYRRYYRRHHHRHCWWRHGRRVCGW